LLIFESILDPIERTVDNINLMFDPQVAPEAMLPWLATWVDLVLNENWPLARRRALVGAAAELYRWRGTRRGLSDYIRIYTGVEPEIIEPGQPQGRSLPANVFRVIIRAPDPSQIDRALVEAIIEAEKPAHTGYLLDIR
jgi:phage tail-like protein